MSGQGGVKGWNVAARRCGGDKMWPPGEVQAKECGWAGVEAGRCAGSDPWEQRDVGTAKC